VEFDCRKIHVNTQVSICVCVFALGSQAVAAINGVIAAFPILKQHLFQLQTNSIPVWCYDVASDLSSMLIAGLLTNHMIRSVEIFDSDNV